MDGAVILLLGGKYGPGDRRIEAGKLWSGWNGFFPMLCSQLRKVTYLVQIIFWLKQGTEVMLRLLRSKQEDVQEKGATALAPSVVIDDENATVDKARAKAVMKGGGIASLLDLAKSCREGVQAEAAKAIANLSIITEVAKTVATEGGIRILAALAKSPNR